MFQVKKISDEGTSEPFIARLMLGILELRDRALNSLFRGTDLEGHRGEFDERYDPVLTALQTARKAAREVASLVSEHSAKVILGAIVEFQPNAVSFRENIDYPLHEASARLLVNGVIALKHLREVTKMFSIDIGGFFQKESQFENAMETLRAGGHHPLQEYLRAARKIWTEEFIQQRADLEHKGWTLPPVRYEQSGPMSFTVREPLICNLPLSEFAAMSVRRLFAFVENVIVYTFKVSLSGPLTIIEIPRDQRDPTSPRRFRVNLRGHDRPEWVPIYSDDDFS